MCVFGRLLFLALSELPAQSSVSLRPSFIITMKSITACVILALAATTWAASLPGELGILFSTRGFLLTVTYPVLSNYRMLKPKENVEGICLD